MSFVEVVVRRIKLSRVQGAQTRAALGKSLPFWMVRLGALWLLGLWPAIYGASLTVAWDPSPDNTVVGYNVYVGQAGTADRTKLTLGQVTQATLDGLNLGITYLIYVTAVDTFGLESLPSSSLVYAPVPPTDGSTPPLSPPTITTQPVGSMVLEGNSIQLSVTVSSTAPPTYQWLRNGLAVPGAISASFTIGSATVADSGSYTVLVQNAGGSVLSTAAQVQVQALNPGNNPGAAAPLTMLVKDSLTTLENSPTSAEPIYLATSDSGVEFVVISAQSLNPDLVPSENILFGGTGASRYMVIVPAQNQHGEASMLLQATQGDQAIVQEVRITVLPVNSPPVISGLPERVILAKGQRLEVPFEAVDSNGSAVSLAADVFPKEYLSAVQLDQTGLRPKIVLMPGMKQAGVFEVSVTAADAEGLSTKAWIAVDLVQPALTIDRSPSGVALSWIGPSGVHIESSDDLSRGWRQISAAPTINEGALQAILPIQAQQRFFRLSIDSPPVSSPNPSAGAGSNLLQ
jgi:hypothetical protein